MLPWLTPYDLWGQKHPFQIPEKKNSLFQRNFVIRIFYTWIILDFSPILIVYPFCYQRIIVDSGKVDAYTRHR